MSGNAFPVGPPRCRKCNSEVTPNGPYEGTQKTEENGRWVIYEDHSSYVCPGCGVIDPGQVVFSGPKLVLGEGYVYAPYIPEAFKAK